MTLTPAGSARNTCFIPKVYYRHPAIAAINQFAFTADRQVAVRLPWGIYPVRLNECKIFPHLKGSDSPDRLLKAEDGQAVSFTYT